MDLNGNGQLIQKEKIISITQFDSADNFERFRWLSFNKRFIKDNLFHYFKSLKKDVHSKRL